MNKDYVVREAWLRDVRVISTNEKLGYEKLGCVMVISTN